MIRRIRALIEARKANEEAAALLHEWSKEGIHEPRNVRAVIEWLTRYHIARK